ncbi:MAG: methylated-DNA--[protein]-cysteine S-methyltransferase [Aeromonas sp.]
MIRYDLLPTPCGPLLVVINRHGLCRVEFQDGPQACAIEPEWQIDPPALAPYLAEFSAYFAGRLRAFTLPCAAQGTAFQQRVWQALTTIPYGETRSYGELADLIGKPTASRAVGAANGRNPLSVIVPCHRVIGANGSLTGYAGGLAIKRALLTLEGIACG